MPMRNYPRHSAPLDRQQRRVPAQASTILLRMAYRTSAAAEETLSLRWLGSMRLDRLDADAEDGQPPLNLSRTQTESGFLPITHGGQRQRQ